MVNADMVNAGSSCILCAIFANILAFWADFDTSKTPLNIRATFELTKRNAVLMGVCLCKINRLSVNFSGLTVPKSAFAILVQHRKAAPAGRLPCQIVNRRAIWQPQ
jgi:hypothetical protein